MPKETSIGLSKETKEKLRSLKTHERESFEEVIERLIGERQRRRLSNLDLKKISSLLTERGAKRIEIFGSYARGEATTESDVDIIVDELDGDLLDLVEAERELSDALNIKVELFTESSLHPLLMDDIKKEARVVSDEA